MKNSCLLFVFVILSGVFISCKEKQDTIVNNHYYHNHEDSLWLEVNGPFGVGLDNIFINQDNDIFLNSGYLSDIYMSSDNGNSWKNLTEAFADTIFMISYNARNELLVYIDNKSDFDVFKSSDKGSTWTRIFDSLPGLRYLYFCDTDSKGNVYTIGTILYPNLALTSLFKSTDKGKTWNIIKDTLNSLDFIIDKDDKIYYRYRPTQSDPFSILVSSSDGGLTWSEISRFKGLDEGQLKLEKDGDFFIYNSEHEYVYKSTDKGRTWAKLSYGNLANEYLTVIEHSYKGNDYAYTNSGIYRSTDFGQNWNRLFKTSNIRKICIDTKGYLYALMNNSAVKRTKNPVE